MEDVITELPPPSRFLLEDLNNFTSLSPPLPPPFLLLQNPNPNLLIIAISPPSLFLLYHASPKTLIGTLVLPEISLSKNSISPSLRDNSCNLYALDCTPSTLIAAVQFPVPADRAHIVARHLINEIRPRKVVVLDSVQRQNFRGRLSADETAAFKLETSNQRNDSEGPIVKNLGYFPSGSVIDGLGAAILARCQVEKIKGTLCVSWPDSDTSVVALLKSLLKEVMPDTEFRVDVGSYQVRDTRNDSELYT